MPYLLGIDIGTTNTKAVLYDLEGRMRAPSAPPRTGLASAPTLSVEGALGQATHDPEELYRRACGVIRQVAGQVDDARQVLALSVSSFGEAGVPLDEQGRPLYPIIVWHDTRTADAREWWEAHFGWDRLFAITGLHPHHTYSLSKIMWLREHEPEAYRRLALWLSVSDYIAYRLTGVAAMNYPQACRTLAFDLCRLDWSAEVLQAAGVEPHIFPRPVPSGQALGTLRPQAAADCGLSEATLVVAGGHDHICASVAAGVTAPGVLLDSIGTAEALLAVLDHLQTDAETRSMGVCCGVHAVPGRYYLLGGLLGVGPLLSWLLQTVLQAPETEAGYQALTQAAQASPRGANGLYMLPFLSGAGAPRPSPRATGAYVGLRLHHTRPDMVRAAFEGLCYELRHLLESFGEGNRVLRAVGGGARNTFWLQLRADVTGCTIEVPAGTERGALGAALLAGVGAGLYESIASAAAGAYRAEQVYHPDPEAHEEYTERYEHIYRGLHSVALMVQ